jgi:TRAP transporter 4TM/12TM fusion protein
MKKAGFRPEVAGAIEAAASLGGSITPPVMGAAAFLVAEFADVPYWDVVIASIAPTALYYLVMFFQIQFESVKQGIGASRGVSKNASSVTRDAFALLKKRGYLLLPVFVIVYLLTEGYSPRYAAVGGIVSLVAVSALRADTRMSVRDLGDGLVTAARTLLVLGSLLVVIGVVVYCVTASGLGQKVSYLMVLYEVPLPGVIISVLAVSLLLGMGVAVTGAYIITAVVAAPLLGSFGVPSLAAHLLILWYAQSATVTPPICLTSFTASAIAESDQLKTAIHACRFAFPLYVIPPLFIYTPLLSREAWWEVLLTFGTCTVGMLAAVACKEGYLVRRTGAIERILLGFSAVSLFTPGFQSGAVGLAVLVFVTIVQKLHPSPK